MFLLSQRQMQEENLRKQEESVQKQEGMRRGNKLLLFKVSIELDFYKSAYCVQFPNDEKP